MPLWGEEDNAASVPKYLTDAEKAKTFFVDTGEAAVEANRDKGLKTGGWNYYEEYGSGRIRVEPLVAMAKTAVEAGDDGFAANTTVEDATVEDPA
jgi:hypothetical protein